MLRSTLIVLATVALALPAAAQAVTTVPLELFKLDVTNEVPPLASPQYDIALGSTVRFEVLAPQSGDLMVFVALIGVDGQPDLNTVVPLWSAPFVDAEAASLEIIIPLGFPEIEVGVQAAFITGNADLYASALHRLRITNLID